MNLAEITAEIAALEKRIELLRAAQTALQALEPKIEKGKPMEWPEDRPRAVGISASIRELLKKNGPLAKADIETALSDRYSLRKGTVSGALQAMKVTGVVARNKSGKWTLKS